MSIPRKRTNEAWKHQHSLTANDRNNRHSDRRRDHVRPILACEDSRFFSVFASGNVSGGCFRSLARFALERSIMFQIMDLT